MRAWLRQKSRHTTGLLALLPLGFLLLMLVAPALRLVQEAWAGSSYDTVAWFAPWQDGYLRGRLLWSLAQAAATCVVALVLGLPVAWVLARCEFTGRSLLMRALMLPFVVPTLVAALGVLALWGPQGLLTRWSIPSLQGTPYLLLYGNLFFNWCVLVRAATEALELVSASRMAAARTLGATPWRVFWRVELPGIAPCLMSALCLVFLYCFSGFGLALILGGQAFATAEVEVYTLVAHELQLGQASVLAAWMMGLTLLVAMTYAALEQGLASPSRADRLPRRAVQHTGLRLAVALTVALWFVVCAAPLLAITWRVLMALWASGSGETATWHVLTEHDTLHALWNTVRFSALALVLATLLGVAHAMAARRHLWLRTLVFLPFVVSPVVVAFGLLLLYPTWASNSALLVAAYAMLAYPFVAKSVASSLDSMPAQYEAVARSLGASRWRVFWRVTLPLLRPALRRGMAFAAATSVGEFAVSLFLARPEWATLTTLIYQRLSRPGAANLEAALLLTCVLMLLALCAFALIEPPAPKEDLHA